MIDWPTVSAVDPIEKFQSLFARAADRAPFDHVAVTLATASITGRPSARVVLLRGIDARGFVFYTNYESRKGRELAENPYGAICCYWPWLGEQVRIEGRIERVTAAESDEYFAGRPRGSQVSAWASDQSRPLSDFATLEQRVQAFAAQYADQPVPRPLHWGGYRVIPDRIEFWREGTDRLHERLLFVREGDYWRTETLYP
jgi:pyridoxamine 5'-phosphate oxidase